MPEVEFWTVNPFLFSECEQLNRVGINFGAAGTRRSGDGTIWLEYPPVASEDFPLDVEIDGETPTYARRHSTSQEGDLSWVKASHLKDFNSVVIDLGRYRGEGRYDIRLHFAKAVAVDSVLVQMRE